MRERANFRDRVGRASRPRAHTRSLARATLTRGTAMSSGSSSSSSTGWTEEEKKRTRRSRSTNPEGPRGESGRRAGNIKSEPPSSQLASGRSRGYGHHHHHHHHDRHTTTHHRE